MEGMGDRRVRGMPCRWRRGSWALGLLGCLDVGESEFCEGERTVSRTIMHSSADRFEVYTRRWLRRLGSFLGP